MEAIEQYMETKTRIQLEIDRLNETLEKQSGTITQINWCHVGDMINALNSLKQLNDQLSGEEHV
jgi:hypothetical protein